MGYFNDIKEGIVSVVQGMKLTMSHLKNARYHHTPTNVQDDNYFEQDKGIVTLEYPFEAIPVPDHGRYRLHNEVDDCIVCDKCAVACPVDCIHIESVKSMDTIKLTSDGTKKKLYAAKFDIDMAKCCYCGLCTAVCPTECLTMTKVYDYSEYDIRDMIYHFGELTEEEAEEKRKEYERKKAEKEQTASQSQGKKNEEATQKTGGMVKPKVKVPGKKASSSSESAGQSKEKNVNEDKKDSEKEDSDQKDKNSKKASAGIKKPKISPKKNLNQSQNGDKSNTGSRENQENDSEDKNDS